MRSKLAAALCALTLAGCPSDSNKAAPAPSTSEAPKWEDPMAPKAGEAPKTPPASQPASQPTGG